MSRYRIAAFVCFGLVILFSLSCVAFCLDVYDDICEQIDDKEPGTYLCISKFFDDVVFEYTIVVMEGEVNLSILTIVEGDNRIEIDFDK